MTKDQVKMIEGVKATISLDPENPGNHWILPYNRSYSLFPRSFTVFHTDFVERPAYYILLDRRLAKFAGMTEEQALDLKASISLKAVETFYAQQKINLNENITSKAGISGSNKGADIGKGSASSAKASASK